MSDELKKGLRGILVAESEMSYIDGDAGKLIYRGYDIEELARAPPVELDENVDEWLQQAGMGTEIPPGKAVAIGTAGLVAVVLLTETDAASDLMDGLSDQLADADLL